MTDIVDIVSDCRGGGDGANFLGKMASKRGAAGGKFLRHEAGKPHRRPPRPVLCKMSAVRTRALTKAGSERAPLTCCLVRPTSASSAASVRRCLEHSWVRPRRSPRRLS